MLNAAADPATTDVLRLRADAGAPPEDLVDLPARAARALGVAREVGGPIGPALDGALAAEDDARRAARAVAVASAQTRVVAGGLLLAPLVLVPGLGRLVGADLAGFYGSGIGRVVLAVGVGLLLLGAGAVVALVRRVGRSAAPSRRRGPAGLLAALVVGFLAWRLAGPAVVPLAALVASRVVGGPRPTSSAGTDEAADLTATALTGGVSVPEALRVAAAELPEHAAELCRLAFDLELGGAFGDAVTATHGFRRDADRAATTTRDEPDPWHRIASVLRTATELGAPVAPTLRRLASDLRADDLARVLAAAERLPAQLTFPTALCLLPATVLLVGAPIVHVGLVATGT